MDIWSLAYHMMSRPISRRKDGWTGVTRASVFVTKSKESGEVWASVKIERGDQHRNTISDAAIHLRRGRTRPRLAISYARVSSPAQTLENGGGGIDRQLEEFHAFRTEFNVTEYTGLGSLVDDGVPGSTGKNIATGALGLFLRPSRSLPPRTGLVVESFSRLNRLHIDEALDVFFDILCKADVPLITLQAGGPIRKSRFVETKGWSIRFLAQCTPRGPRRNISYYSTKSWRSRRGSITNNRPAWIIRVDGVLVLDAAKVVIIVRIFKMALTRASMRSPAR